MKPIPFHQAFVRLLLVAGFGSALLSAGCATRGYERAENTADSVTEAAREIDLARKQVADATQALNILINGNPADLRAGFERYRRSVEALESTYAEMTQKADRMDADGQSYFEEWDKRLAQMRNEDIRARSLERQQEVTTRFRGIQQSYREAKILFPPLLSRLRDIQRLLGVDLTPAGIASARPSAGGIEEDAARLRQVLDGLADRFNQLGATLAPGGTA